MDFVLKLKDIRVKLGKSQVEFAHDLAMSQSQYSKLERGQCDCSLQQILFICRHLGCGLSDVVESDYALADRPKQFYFTPEHFAFLKSNNQLLHLEIKHMQAEIDRLIRLLINSNRERVRLQRKIENMTIKK